MSEAVPTLEARLQNPESPHDRVDILNQLAWELRRSDVEQSVAYHEQALQLLQGLDYDKGTAYAKINSGFYNYSNYGQIGEAITDFQGAIQILDSYKDCGGLGTAFSFLGYLYWSGASYDKAFELVNEALGHHQEVGDQEGIGWDQHTLGGFYEELGELEDAHLYYGQALDTFKGIDNAFGTATALNGIASLCLRKGLYEEALGLLEESLTISEANSLGDSKAGALMQEGDVYWDRGDHSAACSYHLKALMQYQSNGDVLGSLTAKLKLAHFYYMVDDYQEALRYLNQVKEEAPAIQANNKMLEAYKLCSQVHEALGQYKEAFENTKFYSELAERTMGDQRKTQTERIQAIAQAERAQADAEIERLRNVELKEAYTQIEKQQESIVSSIRYASRIQQSILPSPSFLTEHFQDSFLLFKPRDIVSGDFYWFTMSQGRWVVAAIDCTGHGVPGAFMVVLGNTLLADIVLEQGVIDPGQIIHAMDERVTKTLGSGDTQANDGMDVAMVVYDPQDRRLAFAGAKNPLYYVRDGEMNKIKGSVSAIGGQRLGSKPKKFETHYLTAEPGDRFYIFSDGYQDQFGGGNKSKFLTKNFRNLLHQLHALPMAEQQAQLDKTLTDWMGEERQTDDIIVIGMQID